MTPAAIALTEAGRLTSFAELDRRSSQVARALQANALPAGGVRPGDRVAYVGASGPEFAEVMYGAAKCRAIFTAVNNRLSAREVLAILADAEPRVVVADPAVPLVDGVGTLGFDCDTLVTDLDYLAWREAGPSTPAGDPGEVAGPDETALILYTSGTTGTPKGVELTGRNLGCALHELHASIDLNEGSVCAAPIPFFHIAGLGMLLAANLNGGNLGPRPPGPLQVPGRRLVRPLPGPYRLRQAPETIHPRQPSVNRRALTRHPERPPPRAPTTLRTGHPESPPSRQPAIPRARHPEGPPSREPAIPRARHPYRGAGHPRLPSAPGAPAPALASCGPRARPRLLVPLRSGTPP